MVVNHEQARVDDGSGEARAIDAADLPVVEVHAPGPEDDGREVELRSPGLDDGSTEETAGPLVHFGGDALRSTHEHVVAGDGEFQIALVVQGHSLRLT